MALMSADQVAAELQRKKNLGIAPTSAANQGAYDKLTAQPVSATTAAATAPGSTTKTADQYVPYISANPDLINGGNTTEYRAPLSTDNAQMLQAQAPQATNPTPVVTAQPMSANQAAANSQPAPDYAALAAARTAAALAQKGTIAEQQKSSLDRSFARSNQITQDNRQLENGYFDRHNDPRNGRTNYAMGVIGRERSLADETSKGNLDAQKSNIDQLLADYQNATAEEQVRIADELERADRQYKLDLAQLTGNLDGTKTLAAKAQDQNYGLNLAGLSGQLPSSAGGGQTLQSKSLAFDQGVTQAGLTGMYNGQQTMQSKQLDRNNFESDRSYNLAKSSQEWTQTFQKEQYTDQKAQQLWDNSFKDKSFVQSMNDAAASRGLQWASLNQRDKEYIADSAFREKSFTADQDQRKIDNLKSGASEAVSKEIEGLYTGLTSGQISGGAAIQEIDGKVNAGILSKTDAERMKKVITTVTASQPNVTPKLTQDQIDGAGGNNPQDLNHEQLDKLWKTDPTGQAAGRPSLDWASWYRDPQGRVGGVSYDAWKLAYGPQLKG